MKTLTLLIPFLLAACGDDCGGPPPPDCRDVGCPDAVICRDTGICLCAARGPDTVECIPGDGQCLGLTCSAVWCDHDGLCLCVHPDGSSQKCGDS